MKVEQTGFESLEWIWNDLLQKNEVNEVFLTYEWLYTWWKVYGNGKELLLLKVTDNDEIIGIAALMIEKNIIKFIGDPHSDYHDFIISRNKENVIKEIYSYLLNNEKWDYISLSEIPEYSSTIRLLDEFAELRIKKVGYICPYLKLEGNFEEYLKQHHSKSTRKFIRGTIRKLNENGLVFDSETDPDKNLTKFFELHKKRWNPTNTPSKFNNEIHRKFLIEISKNVPWFRLSCMKINEGVLAFKLSFDYNNKIAFYMPCFDPDYKQYSPGFISNNLLLRYCFENNYREFDWLRGDESYKKRLTDTFRNNYIFNIYRNNLKSRLIYLKHKNYEKFKEILRKNDFIINSLRKIRENCRYYFRN